MTIPAESASAGLSGESGNTLTAVAFLFLAASVCVSRLLFQQGLPVGHDMAFHLFQADQFQRCIASGSYLPRWAISANNGYGSPNFIFYAPLSYYLAALIRVFISSPVNSLIIAIWSSFLFSGATMYLAVKRSSGGRGALAAALLYQFLPFHLLNLYGRGAFAELCAYAWFPLVILFAHETLSDRHSHFASAGLSLSYAGLILTHLVSGFIFTFVLLVYGACRYYSRRSARALLQAATALAAGLGLSAFYLIPVIFERKYVQMEYLFNYIFSDYHRNFLFQKSNFGTPFDVSLDCAVSLEILLCLAFFLLLSKRDGVRSGKQQHAAFFIIFIAALFLATPFSSPLWKLFPVLAVIQFPWRWISVMEVSLCFLAGSAFSGTGPRTLLNSGPHGRIALYATIALFAGSLFLIVKSDRMHAAQFLERITDAQQVEQYDNLPREYTPVWATDVEKTIAESNGDKVSPLSGNAEIRILEWQPERRVIGINASSPVRLRIATFFYPGWQAGVDGIETGIAIERKSGAMIVNVPGGEHTLKLMFGATPLRAFSRYVTFGSCAILAIFALFTFLKRIEACKDL